MSVWFRTGDWPAVRRGMVRGPGGFALRSLGLSLDLDPDTLALADGSPVASWTDRAQGFTLAPAPGGGPPTYQTNGPGGHPAVRFDGDDDEVRVAVQGLALVGATAATIYLVYKPDSTDPDDNIRPFSWGTAADNEVGLWGPFSDGNLYFDDGSVAAGARVSGAAPGGFLDAFHIVELWRSGGDAAITVDGAEVVAGTMTDALDVSGTDDFIVGFSDFAGGQAKMDLARLIIAPRALAADERSQAIATLAARYGITLV